MAPVGRASIDHVLMTTALAFARRATCNRLHVGAVIAHSGRIISTGYNGAPAGMPHCKHPVGDYLNDASQPCTAVVHAEANAIAFAARTGLGVEGGQIYCTHAPCIRCATMLVNAGLESVIYCEKFRDMSGIELLQAAGLSVTELPFTTMMRLW